MSLTLAEARLRASTLSDVAYDLALDLRSPEARTFGTRTTIRFTSTASTTFLELTDATDVTVALDGAPSEVAYDGRRIQLTGLNGTPETPTRHEVVVEAQVPYISDGDGMHRFTDPADQATYTCAYIGMDVAQRVFPCFDQNDLKAPFTVSVQAPAEWTVLANGRALDDPAAPAGSWTFSETLPIPTAMFVVCAGPFHSRTWEHAGLPFGWHARASLAAELDRDFDELKATTEACFDHYAGLFTEPMPFGSYDQAFVPGQNWGALETPGCVTYRDEYLPRGRLTGRLRAARATTIAHEMAHMWFGDLVTMTWWEDTWLQESFADYMGFRVAEDAAGYPGLLSTFETSRKATAYVSDARRSTHPVAPLAEDVPDVDAASTNFDMISYAKGNSCLRQLVTWLGDEEFLAGVNRYLATHRLGNATLDDFVAALDAVSERDVVRWSELWLRTTGYDTIRVERADDDTPVLVRDGSRPHRLSVASYDVVDGAPRETARLLVDLDDEPVRLDGWAGRVVVPNVGSETYAQIRLDPASRSELVGGLSRLEDPLARAVVWGSLFADVESGALAPLDYVAVVAEQLPTETDPTLVTAVLARTRDRALPLRVDAADVPTVLAMLTSACGRALEAATDDELRQALVEALAGFTADVDLLHGWLEDGTVSGGPTLDPALRWRVVTRLASLGALDEAAIETERLRDGTIDGELGAAGALAARPTAEAKAAAWSAATDPEVSNRHFTALLGGLWSVEQVDLLAPYVSAYLAEAPELSRRRGQAFSQVVGRAFPALPLTSAQVAELEQALTGDVPTVLRRAWDDRLDDLG
ncbi:aminopeptidase N [Nocardioides sp.]|uniref:aminopeptidase N n=1 Tax=Nocardioides sp. TaxID=35761 RepID=UPI002B275428|nr:aminopeptidase N [Nocardioides sp.]